LKKIDHGPRKLWRRVDDSKVTRERSRWKEEQRENDGEDDVVEVKAEEIRDNGIQ